MSAHLLGETRQPVRLAWAQEPARLLWVLREDGRLLSLTYMREQEIYGWTQHETQGEIMDICVVKEDLQDTLYLVVKRAHGIFVERLMERAYNYVDEYWGVDCGLQYAGTRYENGLEIHEENGIATLTSAFDFALHAGKFVRMAGGLYRIEVPEMGAPFATVLRAATLRSPWNGAPRPGVWYLAEAVDAVAGLAHLEGQTVSILADGDVLPQQQVVDGAVQLGGE